MNVPNWRPLVTILAALALATGGSAFAQSTVLEMPSWQATEPGTSDWWNALIDEFEAQHPDVEIDFTHEPFSGYNQAMVTRFAGGNPPDIFHLPAANFMVYAQEGWLAPLDERMESADSPILDEWTPVQTACEYQGETYCATILGYGYVLGWNEAAFEEAGLDGPPENSDELIEYARELTVDRDGDGTVDQYGFVFPTVTHAGVYVTATQFLFEYADDAHWLDENGELNREGIKYAWSIMRQLIEDGSVPQGLDNNGKRQFWVEGRAAMMLEGPWIQGRIDSAEPDIQPHLQVAHPPVDGAPYGGASNVLAIPADISEERQELAWEFIQLFSTEEWQAKYATIAGQPPARAGVLSDEFLNENENMSKYVEAAESARNYLVPGVEEEFTRFRDLTIEATLAVVVQGQDPDAALDQLDRQTEDLR